MIVQGLSKRSCRKLAVLLFLLAAVSTQGATFNNQSSGDKPDPYKILGVSQHSSLNTIKQKWRSLSRIHHPDKGGSTERFAALSSAYEILSNPEERRKYDQQRVQTEQRQRADAQKQKDAERRIKLFKKQQEAERRIRLRKAQGMQATLLRLRSVDDMLDNGILSKDNTFLVNFIGVFVGNKKQEHSADNDFMFPFPFSGDARNGLQWEDILRTAKIRYNQPTELTHLFRVPQAYMDTPYIIYGQSGDSVSKIHIFSPVQGVADPQEQLEIWIARRLKSRVNVVNHHHSSVNLYLVRDQSKPSREALEFMTTLRPEFSVSLSTEIGDKIIAVDIRVDTFPGSQGIDTELFQGSKSPFLKKEAPEPNPQYFQNPAILEQFIVRGPEITLKVQGTTCFDLSLRCESWILSGMKPQDKLACQQQPEFMHAICPASCGVCHRSRISWIDRVVYTALHAPVYQFPTWIRPCVRFGRFAAHDMHHIMAMRRTVAAVFFAVGVTLGLNTFAISRTLVRIGTKSSRSEHSRMDVLSAAAVFATLAFWIWLHFIAPNSALRRDWYHVLEWQFDAVMGLLGVGSAVALVICIVSAYWIKFRSTPRRTKVAICGMGSLVFCGWIIIIGMTALNLDPTQGRRARWRHVWRMRKNIAVALFFSGFLFGQGTSPIFRYFHGRPEHNLLAVLDFGLFFILKTLPTLDRHYVNDLDHVLRLRMSGAVPIGIAGLLLGFGVPLSLCLRPWKSIRHASHAKCTKVKKA